MAKRNSSREVGLELALIFCKYFLHTKHLHYGYWPADLKVTAANLGQAQENYSTFLLSHVPKGVRRILDVGCGSGDFDLRLNKLGYEMACVSPSPLLSESVRELLGPDARIYQCLYEDVRTEEHYDLLLFSESFQYLDLETALPRAAGLLNDGGHVLICDIFKRDVPGKCKTGGGHRLTGFTKALANSPFTVVEDIDITKETAPTIDLANDVCLEVLHPMWKSVFAFMRSEHPLILKVLEWQFQKKIDKMTRKYFSGERNGADFTAFKTYRLFLLRKANGQLRPSPSAAAPAAPPPPARAGSPA